MNRPELPTWTDRSTEARPPRRRLLARWRAADTDWKSVLVAATFVALVVGLDVPVPA